MQLLQESAPLLQRSHPSFSSQPCSTQEVTRADGTGFWMLTVLWEGRSNLWGAPATKMQAGECSQAHTETKGTKSHLKLLPLDVDWLHIGLASVPVQSSAEELSCRPVLLLPTPYLHVMPVILDSLVWDRNHAAAASKHLTGSTGHAREPASQPPC